MRGDPAPDVSAFILKSPEMSAMATFGALLSHTFERVGAKHCESLHDTNF